jgi:hypothetical protein
MDGGRDDMARVLAAKLDDVFAEVGLDSRMEAVAGRPAFMTSCPNRAVILQSAFG